MKKPIQVLIAICRNIGRVSFVFFLKLPFVYGQVISTSAEEVSFRYHTQFILQGSDKDAENEAISHSSYIFGVFHSPTLVRRYRINPDLIEGIGAPRIPLTVKVLSVDNEYDESDKPTGQKIVSYQVYGRLLLAKKVAEILKIKGELDIVLPYSVSEDEIYDVDCTDEYYAEFGDYWYFWDPYRHHCRYLLKPPYTKEVTVHVTPLQAKPSEEAPHLKKLQGDNGNGDLLSVYIVNGFSEGPRVRDDEGRENFNEIRTYFKDELGFDETKLQAYADRPMNLYTKTLGEGERQIQVEVRHLLANTDIDSRALTFARFFKEAVENADVVMYLGHSGLGSNLDISYLEEKAGEFQFKKDKYQIFYFDSCASYSYYLQEFVNLKPKSKIDILSFGLSTYFVHSTAMLSRLIESLLSFDKAEKWEHILKTMESELDGASYLLNVGGV